MKIAVLGLGYVGAVTSACLARDGHEVLGIDPDQSKLDSIRAGRAPIVESQINEITQQAVSSGRLVVHGALDADVGSCDLVFICVGTPSAPNGSQDLSAVRGVSTQLGAVLRDASTHPVVVLRSTVPPGTTEDVVIPILEQTSGKQAGVDFGVCFQPEFLREGSSVGDFYQPPLTVVGGDAKSADVVKRLFEELQAPFVVTDIKSAELLKVACNTLHALKVTFANEIGRLGQTLGIDARVVMDLVCMDRQLNISPAYLRPGFAFGGSCLPKDLRALLYLAKAHDVTLPLLQAVLPSNSIQIDTAVGLVIAGRSRKVGLLGLSFKQGTDDLRESPLVTLAEQLIGKGYDLRIHDPAVSIAMLTGSNKRFIDATIPHMSSLIVGSIDDVLAHADTVVVGHKNEAIVAALARNEHEVRRVVDLAGIDPSRLSNIGYVGVAW